MVPLHIAWSGAVVTSARTRSLLYLGRASLKITEEYTVKQLKRREELRADIQDRRGEAAQKS